MVRIRIGAEEVTLAWEEWEHRVRGGRIPPTALVRFDPVTGDSFVPASGLEMYSSLRDDAVARWQNQFASDRAPVLTALLVGIQIRIWWLAHLPELHNNLIENFTLWSAPFF